MNQDNHISWNRILDIVKNVAIRHQMLKGYAFGDTPTRTHSKDENKQVDPPWLFVDPVQTLPVFGSGAGIVAKEYTIRMFVADKHSDNAKNEQEITSDTEHILSDIIQWIATSEDLTKYKVKNTITPLRLVKHTTIEDMFGHECDMTIRVPYSYCAKDLPIGPDVSTC